MSRSLSVLHVNKSDIFQRPGKPCSEEIKSSSVKLTWRKSADIPEYYQIRYKCLDERAKLNFTDTNSNENKITVSGLMAYKQYKFQVRGIFGDLEGPYSETSEIIETKESLAEDLLKLSTAFRPNSSKHIPPIEEHLKARNSSIKIKQLTIGSMLFNIFLTIKYLKDTSTYAHIC